MSFRRDERDRRLLVDAHERLVDLRLRLEPVALELEPEVLGPEEVAQLDRECQALRLAIGDQELRQLAGEASRQARDPARVSREQLAIDPRAEW
jgi:hypothetical protein